MKWEEIEYFFSSVNKGSILDVWCGNGRLLGAYIDCFKAPPEEYVWVDLSDWLVGEARLAFPDNSFIVKNMIDIWVFDTESFDNIFFIASFHHLWTLEERLEVLAAAYKILNTGGKIYMTNWALESELNKVKYLAAKIPDSENEFRSSDFNIKIWKFDRYYHSFSLRELEYLAEKSGLEIIENRVFESDKNIITILKK